MKLKYISLTLATLLSTPLYAGPYIVDKAQSKITFSGLHIENQFSANLDNYQIDINFDAQNLASSSIQVVFFLNNIKTGDSIYDATLIESDWLNLSKFKTAKFISNNISQEEENLFKADGKLTIKTITMPLTFKFRLSDLGNSSVKAISNLEIDRLNYEIGKDSDPEAEWVSRNINIDIELVAKEL